MLLNEMLLVIHVFIVFVTGVSSLDHSPVHNHSKPTIVLIVGDDVGWNSVGFHGNNDEVKTPRLDALAREGAIFERLYAYFWCSPTRASILSGRYPHHVYQESHPATAVHSGLPLSMTTLADRMSSLGYETVQAGKWHVGFGQNENLPVSRGFNTSFGFLEGAEDHFSQQFCSDDFCLAAENDAITDMWRDAQPAHGENNTGPFGDDLWTAHVTTAIGRAAASGRPLFAYLALSTAHSPLQAPEDELAKYDERIFHDRRMYAGMMSALDTNVGKVVDALVHAKMWDNTLLVFCSDNGGPVYYNNPKTIERGGTDGGGGSNNYPLRGGKMTMLEGGVRVSSLVAGGALPESTRRAGVVGALSHVADISVTLCSFAGGDTAACVEDGRSDAAGLPPVDGLDLGPVLRGERAQVREALPLAVSINFGAASDNQTSSAIVTDRGLKLLVGASAFYFDQAPLWPTAKYDWVWDRENYLQ